MRRLRREHRCSHFLNRVRSPSWARSGGGVGAAILDNLRASGFAGRIVPIHPQATELQGLPAYSRLTDVPGPLDLAIIVVPAAAVISVVNDAIAKGVKALVVISAGFAETDAVGRRLQDELLTLVRAAGVRMIGPNCMGIVNADPAVMLNATFAPVFPPSGHTAFSTQSGALGLAILEYARRVNLGLSTFASIGNKADVSSNDLIQYWSDDPQTRVILLYLESFGNPRKFAQLARDVGRRNPQLFSDNLRVGRLVTLTLRLRAEPRDRFTRGVNADFGAVEHLQPEDVEVL